MAAWGIAFRWRNCNPATIRSRSGTEYECFSALEGADEGFRELLVYRKTASPAVDKLNAIPGLKTVCGTESPASVFVNAWFLDEKPGIRRPSVRFSTAGEFVETLQSDLAETIGRIISLRQLEPRESADGPALELVEAGVSVPRIVAVRISTFALVYLTPDLRRLRRSAFAAKAGRRRPGLRPGSGGRMRTSFVSAGVLPLLTEPGVIEGVGLCAPRRIRSLRFAGRHDRWTSRRFIGWLDVLPELSVDGLNATKLAQLLWKNPPAAGRRSRPSPGRHAITTGRGSPGTPGARLVLAIDGLEQMFAIDAIPEEHRLALITALAGLVVQWLRVDPGDLAERVLSALSGISRPPGRGRERPLRSAVALSGGHRKDGANAGGSRWSRCGEESCAPASGWMTSFCRGGGLIAPDCTGSNLCSRCCTNAAILRTPCPTRCTRIWACGKRHCHAGRDGVWIVARRSSCSASRATSSINSP